VQDQSPVRGAESEAAVVERQAKQQADDEEGRHATAGERQVAGQADRDGQRQQQW